MYRITFTSWVFFFKKFQIYVVLVPPPVRNSGSPEMRVFLYLLSYLPVLTSLHCCLFLGPKYAGSLFVGKAIATSIDVLSADSVTCFAIDLESIITVICCAPRGNYSWSIWTMDFGSWTGNEDIPILSICVSSTAHAVSKLRKNNSTNDYSKVNN